MTDSEIVKMYREAKYPKEHIQIMADMNLCSKRQIIDILNDNGYDIPYESAQKRKRCAARKPSDDAGMVVSSSMICPIPTDVQRPQIPETVVNLTMRRIGELDSTMQTLTRQAKEIDEKLKECEKEYTELVSFLKI